MVELASLSVKMMTWSLWQQEGQVWINKDGGKQEGSILNLVSVIEMDKYVLIRVEDFNLEVIKGLI